jgi:hypothetical protein
MEVTLEGIENCCWCSRGSKLMPEPLHVDLCMMLSNVQLFECLTLLFALRCTGCVPWDFMLHFKLFLRLQIWNGDLNALDNLFGNLNMCCCSLWVVSSGTASLVNARYLDLDEAALFTPEQKRFRLASRDRVAEKSSTFRCYRDMDLRYFPWLC